MNNANARRLVKSIFILPKDGVHPNQETRNPTHA
jgi:hypothetical protein